MVVASDSDIDRAREYIASQQAVINKQHEELCVLRSKMASVDKRAIKYKILYGELWDLLDRVNEGMCIGDVSIVGAALAEWLRYGVGGEKK